MSRKRMTAIFFDLYETLVTHFDPDWAPPPRTIAQRLGLAQDTYDSLWRRFDTAWQAGEISGYSEALAQTCSAGGREPDDYEISLLTREYQVQTEQVFTQIEAEIVEMVDRPKRRGFKLGIITNASDLDAAPWFDCCLAPYFDDFVASHEVGLLKRDTRIFELACHRLNIQPSEAIFVGDGGGNELHNAASAGLQPYWCAWFLDRWPEGIRPNGFPGGEWRQYVLTELPPFERLARPSDVLNRFG